MVCIHPSSGVTGILLLASNTLPSSLDRFKLVRFLWFSFDSKHSIRAVKHVLDKQSSLLAEPDFLEMHC